MLYGEDEKKCNDTISVLTFVLVEIMKLLHPFVPFITEKIYKSIPNTNGPLMLSDFPRYNTKFNYTAAVKEIEPTKEIIKCIRNLKAQVGAVPSKKVNLYVKTENKKVIKNCSVYIEKLAGVSEISIIEDKNNLTEKVVSQVIDGFELFIPLGELVDFDKEIERLERELHLVNNEIARASGKLANEKFLEKAPKNLVDAEREKLNKYIDMRDKLLVQIKDLKG